MSKKKVVTVTSRLVKEFNNDPSADVNTLAEKYGVSTSLVYGIRRRITEPVDQSKPVVKPSNKPPKESQEPPIVAMSLRLPTSGASIATVQVRDNSDQLLGTLVLSANGIGYRRPNQKTVHDRTLSWAILDKLMQLGFVN